MLVQLRRLFVMIALMFWLGGFTFYAAIVVPAGQKVLGSHRRQGFVTQHVTNLLNLSTAVALLPLALDVAWAPDKRWRRAARWACLGMILALVGYLAVQHRWLDEMLDLPSRAILSDAFYGTHRLYLWTSTVQWAAGLVFTWLSLSAWRDADVNAHKKSLAGVTLGVAQSPEQSASETT